MGTHRCPSTGPLILILAANDRRWAAGWIKVGIELDLKWKDCVRIYEEVGRAGSQKRIQATWSKGKAMGCESLLAILRFGGEESLRSRNIVATRSWRNGLWPAEIQLGLLTSKLRIIHLYCSLDWYDLWGFFPLFFLFLNWIVYLDAQC